MLFCHVMSFLNFLSYPFIYIRRRDFYTLIEKKGSESNREPRAVALNRGARLPRGAYESFQGGASPNVFYNILY